jgi:hypothetical protein
MICRNRSHNRLLSLPSPGTPGEGQGEGLAREHLGRSGTSHRKNPRTSPLPEYPEREKSDPHLRARCCVVAVVALACGIAHAENWPAWRGAQGTGLSSEKNLPLKWSAKENVLWRTQLPDRGNSTPIVWGDRIFITQATEKDHRRTVMCFGRSDGKLLWQSGVTCNEAEPTNGLRHRLFRVGRIVLL